MQNDYIILKGCRENNLKNISLTIPKRKITVFTGVSGSGKSSIVFDTIAQEAGRQLNETFSNMVRLFLPRYQQPAVDIIENISAAIVIDQKRIGGNSRSTVGTITDINSLLRVLFSRFATPHLGYGNAYSFNDPLGMCPQCEGIGKIITVDESKIIDPNLSLNEGAIIMKGFKVGSFSWNTYASTGFFDLDKKIKDYTDDEYHKLMHAKAEKITAIYLNSEMQTTYEGICERYMRQNVRSEKVQSTKGQNQLETYTSMQCCPACLGKRYNDKTLSSTIMGYSIYDMTDKQPDELITILKQMDDVRAKPLLDSIISRLQNLIDIGLDYITLTRLTSTLSGGESQRIKMVKHLTSSLSDMLYIFDEPSIGLHPNDVHSLNELLLKLKDKGNTIIIVEHDPDVIKIADYIVDMGPLAGCGGGEIMYAGTYEGLKQTQTLTAKYLNRTLSIKQHPRLASEYYESSKSSLHNLKNVSLKIPKGVFSVISGVAGSGKSTLVNEVFAKEFRDVIRIDQSPLNANSRSNPATYIGIMDNIRQCFAQENNVSAGLFSYNSEGACETCKGSGVVELNLSFMDKVEVPCNECQGTRFKPIVLKYLYQGYSIVDILYMTLLEALEVLHDSDTQKKLQHMIDVGLGYLALGQPINTLSGGECQRLKLAKELSKKGNIYILDEPTTGLHMADIEHILAIINHLVDQGNTLIAIEHNLDIIRNADYIIDMGINGGKRGGDILFAGKPIDLLNCPTSITAKFLKNHTSFD